GESEHLRRAITNIVDNACKFAPDDGHVAVKVAHLARAGGTVQVRVVDDGPGVPAGERQRVFDRFFRASTALGVPGHGLGLALARDVVRAHGGDVWLAPSTQGTEVVLELPAAG